nr:hypothetical protein [Massilia sp. CCM 8734]
MEAVAIWLNHIDVAAVRSARTVDSEKRDYSASIGDAVARSVPVFVDFRGTPQTFKDVRKLGLSWLDRLAPQWSTFDGQPAWNDDVCARQSDTHAYRARIHKRGIVL